MKLKIFILIVSVLLLNNILLSDGLTFYSDENGFYFENFLNNSLPGSYFPNFFLENYASDVTLLIEENNGFSLFDNPRVYFEGNSFLNFNWLYNGFNINSALDNGRSAFIIPFGSINSYQLNGDSPSGRKNGLNILTESKKNMTTFILSDVYGDLGSYTPLGPVLIQPEHPIERDDMLYSTRRKILNSYFADFSIRKISDKSNFSFSLTHTFMKRRFNDFTKKDKTFEENLKGLFISTSYNRKIKNGYIGLFSIFNTTERDNAFAELGRLLNETYGKTGRSFFLGLRLRKDNFKFDISFIGESENSKPFYDNFKKDILDNDGDDIYPFYDKVGIFSSKIFAADINYKLINKKKLSLSFYSNMRNSIVNGEETSSSFNSVFFNEDPYRVFLWNKGREYSNSNLNINSGMLLKVRLSDNFIFSGKLFFNYRNLDFEFNENDFNDMVPGYDLGFKFKMKKTRLSLSFGQYPGEMNENVNTFLETNRPYATVYNWSDINSDGRYETGEEGSIAGYSGGRYHFLDDNLKSPYNKRLLILFSTKISRNYSFNIKGLYKKFFNNFRIEYKDDYGFYKNYNGDNLYFYDKPYENFYLTNSKLDKDPFYAQLLINFSGRVKERWFLSFSLMAHIGMGYTAFGNGPDSNDIGILSESMADPNSLINGYGRVDGDRGYVSKFYFGFKLTEKLFFSTSIKYRDGDPFAFLSSYSKYGQNIIYYSTIKAENEKGIKGGPREDYIADLSVKLRYNFRLFNKLSELSLSFFNVIDIGGELSEYVFSGGERYSIEMQLPKSLRLNLKIAL